MALGSVAVLLYYWYIFVVHGGLGEAVYWPSLTPPPHYRPPPTSKPVVGFQIVRLNDRSIAAVSTEPGHRPLFLLDLQSHPTYYVSSSSLHHNDPCVISKDSCHGMPTGSIVPATGQELYEHVARRLTVEESEQVSQQRDDVLLPTMDSEKIFYFTCGAGGQIDRLHACSPGTVLDSTRQRCEPVDPCKEAAATLGRGRNSSIADVFDRHFYYQCDTIHKKGIRHECPDNTWFFHDSCRPLTDFEETCLSKGDGFVTMLDARTYLLCEQNRVVVRKCESNQLLFSDANNGEPACEPNACMSHLPGTRVPMDSVTKTPFVYVPGYYVCGKGGRVDRTVLCPKEWDTFQTACDVTSLPMVFDGKKCTAPELCTNVDLEDNSMRGEIVVSEFRFQKRVKEWKKSVLFDSTRGFNCEGRQGLKRQMISHDAPAGQLISKKFRFEDGCTNTNDRIPIASTTEGYFDCRTRQQVACPSNHYFDGVECRQKRDNDVFELDGIQLFRLEDERPNANSAPQNSIAPWDYSSNPSPFKNKHLWRDCVEPESKYLNGFNVCAHPDCEPFPYLTWLEKSYAITGDGSVCIFQDNKLKKVDEASISGEFDFWTQSGNLEQRTPEQKTPAVPTISGECQVGSHVRTGYFTIDSTVLSTCDPKMPFVFCPYPGATIERVDDGVFACVPPAERYILPANVWTRFAVNELERLEPLEEDTWFDMDGAGLLPVRPEGVHIGGKAVKLLVTKRARLEYRYTVTYPPWVKYEEPKRKAVKANSTGFNYLLSKDAFTEKALAFPKYKVKPTVPEYQW